MSADRLRRRWLPALVAAVLLTSGQAATPATAATEVAVTAAVTLSPLLVSLELEPATATVGELVKARATVLNAGPHRVGGIVVELRLDSTAMTVRGGRPTIRSLEPGKRSSVSWSICTSRTGTYLVLAQATAQGVVTESSARLLTILPGPRRNC